MTEIKIWKPCPREPDDGMIEAGSEAMAEGSEWGRMASCADVWCAMWDAVPPAPGAEVEPYGYVNSPNRAESDGLIYPSANNDGGAETPVFLSADAIRAQARREALEEAAKVVLHYDETLNRSTGIFDGLAEQIRTLAGKGEAE